VYYVGASVIIIITIFALQKNIQEIVSFFIGKNSNSQGVRLEQQVFSRFFACILFFRLLPFLPPNNNS